MPENAPDTQTELENRRPIAARGAGWAHWLAAQAAAAGASPDLISALSFAFAALGAGLLLWAGAIQAPWLRAALLVGAAAMIQARLVCNLIDGMVAVETRQASPVGELFNEVPDRVSDAAILIGAGYASGATPELGYLAACVALFVAYVRAEGKVAGAPQEFCGPMAKPQRMFTIATAALLTAVAPLDDFGWMALALLVVSGGCVWTVLRRLRRIVWTLPRKGS